jgi:hypothetical protein
VDALEPEGPMNWIGIGLAFFVGYVLGQGSMVAILYLVSNMVDRENAARDAIAPKS